MNEEARIKAGARAFGFWAGISEIISHPATFLDGLAEPTKEKLTFISKMLYSPPGENIISPPAEYLNTPVDEFFRDIAREVNIKPIPFWPEDAPYAVCLTHDIDRIRRTYQFAVRSLRQKNFRGALRSLVEDITSKPNPYDNFDLLTGFEKEWGIRSALYVLFERRRFRRALFKGEVQHVLGVYKPENIKDHLRNMRKEGFEIGLHGSFDAWRDESALSREMNLLAQLLGTENMSYGGRNHYLQFDVHRTPAVQKNCGLVYDSTLGFNFMCGFRCGTAFPFALVHDKRNSLIELPLNIMDTALRFSAPEEGAHVAERIAEKTRQNGGLLMINWHQHFCNPHASPDIFKWVEKTIEKASKDRAYIRTPMDVANRWLERAYDH